MEGNILHKEGEIVLYQPNESIRLEVKLDTKLETVWLNRQQISELFGRDIKTIGKHIANALKEELSTELAFVNGPMPSSKDSVVANFATTYEKSPFVAKFATVASDGKTYQVEYYNLDVILSVGYRVKSCRGIQFRWWATNILKSHLLNGYSVNRQLVAMQERNDERFLKIEEQLERHEERLDFFITTNTPPAEMVFFEGDFYKARVALENLVKTAKTRVIIIDRYVNSLTLSILDVRATNVEGIIYTNGVGVGMRNLMSEHDKLFPNAHIDIRKWQKESHDRWLIIDDRLYHCGHSLNANGAHKISAITLMGTKPEVILGELGD